MLLGQVVNMVNYLSRAMHCALVYYTVNMLVLASTSDLAMSSEILRLSFDAAPISDTHNLLYIYGTSTGTFIQHRSSCSYSVGGSALI